MDRAEQDGQGELPCNRVLVIDEAHLFLEHKEMRMPIERIIKRGEFRAGQHAG